VRVLVHGSRVSLGSRDLGRRSGKRRGLLSTDLAQRRVDALYRRINAMDEFDSMLRQKAYGIDGAMAEELYNLALTIRSPYEEGLGVPTSSERERNRLMISPAMKINMQPQDRVWCHEGGCDEWIADPNAG
jgi:hypothetical protein